MKNIRLYELESEYLSDKENLEYPTVSYTKDTEEVHYLLKPSLVQWVDLGLPSGLKWAAWNLGATKPEEIGLLFPWGETQGYPYDYIINNPDSITWDGYKFTNDGGATMTKYNKIDGLTTLEAEDDAATAFDSSCRMPTRDDAIEMLENTTYSIDTVNGINGFRLTSKFNNNSIFCPAIEEQEGAIITMIYVSTLSDLVNKALAFGFASPLDGSHETTSLPLSLDRCSPCLIRPVK